MTHVHARSMHMARHWHWHARGAIATGTLRRAVMRCGTVVNGFAEVWFVEVRKNASGAGHTHTHRLGERGGRPADAGPRGETAVIKCGPYPQEPLPSHPLPPTHTSGESCSEDGGEIEFHLICVGRSDKPSEISHHTPTPNRPTAAHPTRNQGTVRETPLAVRRGDPQPRLSAELEWYIVGCKCCRW